MPPLFAPKRPSWFKRSLAIMGVALAIHAVWAWWTPWRAGRLGGLIFGTLAGVIFVLDGLYPLRRRLLAWPLRNAQQWLQFHIYGGVVAMLFVMIHMGFTWPHGTMGWWLFGLSTWTTVTGLLGVALQKWIPIVVAGSLRVEALATRIPELTADLLAAADDVMRGASERVVLAYQSEIRPRLERPEPMWFYVANVQAGRARYQQSLETLDRVAPDHERVSELRTIV